MNLELLKNYNKLAFASLVVSVILITGYWQITDLWWMFDDAQHLKLVSLTNLDVFIRKASEVGYIPANFTPWMFLNYWIDLNLFGLNSAGAFYHQLLSLIFTAIAVFLLLSRLTSPLIALCTTIYFFFTPVAHTVIHILCTRHYLEGLGFISLGLLFFLKYRDTGSFKFLWASCIFSLIAFLNKEVYVPVIGIIFCICFFDYCEKRKAYYFIPVMAFSLIVFLYVVYRGYALGWSNLLTGYGSAVEHNGIEEVYGYIKEILHFNKILPIAILMLLVFPIYLVYTFNVAGVYCGFKILGYIIAVLICVLVPVYKVMPTANVNHNYIFVSTFVLIMMASFLFNEVLKIYGSRPIRLFFLSFFLLILFYQHLKVLPNATLNAQNKSLDLFERFRVEGEYLLYSKDLPEKYLLNPIGAPWHHSGLVDLRNVYLKAEPGPRVCYNLCECKNAASIYSYDAGLLVSLPFDLQDCKVEQSDEKN